MGVSAWLLSLERPSVLGVEERALRTECVFFSPLYFFIKIANHSYLCKNAISGSLMPSCSALNDIAWKTSTICTVDQAFLAWHAAHPSDVLRVIAAGGHGLVQQAR